MSTSKIYRKAPVQWCDLPIDPGSVIISRLDAIDTFNFSATCRNWASICKHIEANILKSGRPVLITSQPDQDGTRVDDDIRTGKFGIHTVYNELSFLCEREGLQRRCWLGGKDGWLATTNTRLEVELLNPINGYKVSMPSFNNDQDDLKINDYPELSLTFDPFTRFLRRIVICRTPAQRDGYEAIAMFSDGLLTYTSENDSKWRVLKNPTDKDDNDFNYDPVNFHDSIVFHGWVVAVDEDGEIFAWDINNLEMRPMVLQAPSVQKTRESTKKLFYLAISPNDQLMLVSLFGHPKRYDTMSMRMVWKPNDTIDDVTGISVHKFVEENSTWVTHTSIGDNQTLFLGLNYPFYVTSKDHEKDSIYVSDVANNDVVIYTLTKDATVHITKKDFPVDEHNHFDHGYTVRTPMWFRPTDPRVENL